MASNHVDEETIRKIRSSVDIVDVISSYIPLTGAGKNFFGVCPFHDDHSPSMSVSREKQIYKCFSCGAGGNVFTFVQDYENITFLEAVKKLADKVGILVNLNVGYKETNKYPDYYEMYELANKLYINNLNTTLGKEARAYLNKRGLDANVIKEFKIGLALNQKDTLVNLLLKKGFKEEKLEEYGLATKHQYGSSDKFYQRIMVPLFDLQGRVVGFSGRIYNDLQENKYVNTKQTVVFKKGELLYNYHRAKDIARKKNRIIVVEGYMDVIGLYKIGINEVVATMGTAVTKEQLLEIKKMAKEIYLCFDGDDAGLKATWVATNELIKMGVEPKIIRLEDNLDPDEYIKKNGSEAYLKKLDYPMNIMEFKLAYLKKNKDFTNTLDVSKYANEVVKELVKIDDPILKELTLSKVSEEVGIEKQVLTDLLKSLEDENKEKPVVILKEEKSKKITKYQKAEEYLLYYMLNEKEVIKKYQKKTIYFPTKEYRELARAAKNYYEEFNDISVSDLISYLRDQEDIKKTLKYINSLSLKDEWTKEEIADYFKVIQDYNYKSEIARLKEELKRTSDIKLKLKISNQIIQINKQSKGEENEKSN